MHYNIAKSVTVATAIACALASSAQAAMTISNARTKNVSCVRHVCTPTGGNANLNTGKLQTMLAASDVTVKSNAAAPDIGIADPLTWASTHRLTLDAYEAIHVRAPVAVEGTAGLTLTTNDGGSGGDYTFNTATSGAIQFWDTASSLVINGQIFTLVKDIATLAGDIASAPSGTYALANNYDASADGPYGTAPVQTTFAGTFEGLGNAINQFTVVGQNGKNQTVYAGLFVRNAGTLRDLVLGSVSISMKIGRTGPGAALVIYNEGTVSGVSANGAIDFEQVMDAGGLVFTNDGIIAQSTSNVAISGENIGGVAQNNSASGSIEWSSFGGTLSSTESNAHAGGITETNNGTIEHSSSAGNIHAPTAGGIACRNYGAITLSQAKGPITSQEAGGLVAYNYATIAQSFATGPTTSAGTGGLVSRLVGGSITQSYATGSVTQLANSSGFDGGLVGAGDTPRGVVNIVQSYSTGFISRGATPTDKVGGLIGVDYVGGGHSQNSYWNLDTSGIDDPSRGAGHPLNDPGITGLTDAQLKSALPAGFDPNVWGQNPNINNGWPYLLANPPQ